MPHQVAVAVVVHVKGEVINNLNSYCTKQIALERLSLDIGI